ILRADLDPFVVVVDGDGQDLLRMFLSDDILIEERVDLRGLGELVELQLGGLGELLLDDLVAQVDALVADVHAGAGDQLLHLLLALAAEGALQQVRVTELRHAPFSLVDAEAGSSDPARRFYAPAAAAAASSGVIPRFVMISSITP